MYINFNSTLAILLSPLYCLSIQAHEKVPKLIIENSYVYTHVRSHVSFELFQRNHHS